MAAYLLLYDSIYYDVYDFRNDMLDFRHDVQDCMNEVMIRISKEFMFMTAVIM